MEESHKIEEKSESTEKGKINSKSFFEKNYKILIIAILFLEF